MFKIPCRCGKTHKNFHRKIGEFFINDCCEEAGYDHNGELTKKEVTKFTDETLTETDLEKAQDLQVADEPELDAEPEPIQAPDSDEPKETKKERKAREAREKAEQEAAKES